MREEIIAATVEKFGGEGWGPVGAIGFERVGEDGVRRGVAEGFDEGFTDGFEVGGYGLLAEGIENVAFGPDGCSLDLLFGVVGDVEKSSAGFVGGRDGDGGGGESKRLGRCGVPSDRWLRGVV